MKKTAIVTGGTGALGSAVARKFAELGYDVHVTSLFEAEVNAWQGPGRGHAVDLSNLDAVRAFARGFGEVHALALCAGGYAGAEIAQLTSADLEGMMTINYKTASYCLAAFASNLVAGSAAIVVGSQAYEGAAGSAPYAASKAACVSLARSAALEWKQRNVRVNAVLPDTLDTPANRRAMPNADFDRWSRPEQVADVIAWLCSPEAAVVSGNAIKVGK